MGNEGVSLVRVTGGTGFVGRRLVRAVTGPENVPPRPGKMSAVIVDIPAARALGCKPLDDLKSGRTGVWPDSSEAVQ